MADESLAETGEKKKKKKKKALNGSVVTAEPVVETPPTPAAEVSLVTGEEHG